MSGNQFEGTVRHVAGKAEEAVGGAMGDTATEMRGKMRKVAGQAQNAMGDAVEHAREIATEQPLASILLAAGVGFVAGMLVARR